MRRHRLSLALAALAVVAGACGGGGQPVAEDPSTPPHASSSASPSPASDGSGPAASPAASTDRLFAFEAARVTGGTYDAAQLSGRDVAIWFWAPW